MKHIITPIDELPDFVLGEIYLAKNTKNNNKPYVGQTRTHILNHGKYRPFGSQKRWVQHTSEAIGQYQHQSAKLNNAIRKYGGDSFEVTLLETCPVKDLNEREKHFIIEYDSLKNGYNLTHGGDTQFITEEGRQNIANTLIKYNTNKRLKKFEGKNIQKINIEYKKQLDMEVVKVFVHVGEKKPIGADFGGKKCTIEDSAKRAKEFTLQLTNKEKITISPKLQHLIIFD
jgi:hypothetical protein